MTQQLSNAINNLRFPLMGGVVLIHNVVIDPVEGWNKGYHIASTVVNLFSWCLTSPCVPLFFFISGFLFFGKIDSFSTKEYFRKLQKRARSLFVPYIFWNVIVLLYFAFMHQFTPNLVNPEFNNVYSFTWQEWLLSFWNYPGGQPICFQFWFLRDLMLMVVCSPMVYLVSKYGKWMLPIVLATFWLYDNNLFPMQMAITFFILGASFAIHKWDFSTLSSRCWKISLFLWLVSIIVRLCFPYGDIYNMNSLTVLSGAVVYMYAASIFKSKQSKVARFLAASGFFVYAFHGFPIGVIQKVFNGVMHPASDLAYLTIYVASFSIIMVTSLGLYYIMRKTMPTFTAIITGGR